MLHTQERADPGCKRNFRFISIVGFVMILQSTWESVLLWVPSNLRSCLMKVLNVVISAAQYGLTNGGMAGVIWVTVGVLVGALCMIASIAEMASMSVVILPRRPSRSLTKGFQGLQLLEGSTIGYPSLLRGAWRNRLATSLASELIRSGYLTPR